MQVHRVSLCRQLPSRYAVRAGQNLPDKEFRYLRTIIVIAGVHQGLKIKLTPHLLNLLTLARRQPLYFILRFKLQGPVFLINSRLASFAASALRRKSLFLSYGHFFAEFLKESSPDCLFSYLRTFTCVGLRYEQKEFEFRSFSRRLLSTRFPFHKGKNFTCLY